MTRLLIEVLLLHRRMHHARVMAGIRVTLETGSVAPDVVAIEARKHPAATAEAATQPQQGRVAARTSPRGRTAS